MFIAILILIIIASLLLTFVVLIQNSKGGGLAANFAAGNQTFGVSRKQGDNAVLERLEQMGTNTGTPEFPTTLPGGDAAPAEPADPAAAPAE